MMMTVMLLNIWGYDRVVDVEGLERDSGLRHLIGCHELHRAGHQPEAAEEALPPGRGSPACVSFGEFPA